MTLIGSISPETWPGRKLSMFPEDGPNRHGIYSCEVKDPITNVLTKAIALKMGLCKS